MLDVCVPLRNFAKRRLSRRFLSPPIPKATICDATTWGRRLSINCSLRAVGSRGAMEMHIRVKNAKNNKATVNKTKYTKQVLNTVALFFLPVSASRFA